VTAAELVRYNLARLIRESGRDELDIALAAWPLPMLSDGERWRLPEYRAGRKKRLARILASSKRPSDAALEDLARALGRKLSDFYQEPAN
jgi:hypothetical protein